MSCALALGVACVALPLDAGILPQAGVARYELAFWDSIKHSTRPEDYKAYLEAFPKGRFVPLAKARAHYLRADSDTKPAPPNRDIEELKATYEVIKSANVRAGPSGSARVLGTVQKGEKVQVTGRSTRRNWFRVVTDREITGFVYGDLVQAYPQQQAADADKTPSANQHAVISGGEKTASTSKTRPAVQPPDRKVSRLATFKDCSVCPQMIGLPAGEFIMGDDRGSATEQPAHRVFIDSPFAIGKDEVTVAEWHACVLAGGCDYSPTVAGSDPVAPVRGINWNDAQQYVTWLSSKTGQSYRLPTEAQWEYAARGGTTTRYWWGDSLIKGLANCRDCGPGYDHHTPAATRTYRPNPFGLHEMAGGVWEWVRDCWHNSYHQAPNDGSAREGGECRLRVLRGGSWRNDSRYVRSTSRKARAAHDRHLANGFRVAKSPTQTSPAVVKRFRD